MQVETIMIETELKSILTKDQYDIISTIFNWEDTKTQINSYYISPDNILKKHGITFRVRTINGEHILQIKKHNGKNGALQVSEETEFPINSIPDEFSGDEVFKYTKIKAPASLIGELKTIRNSVFFADGVEVCLDKSEYLGTTDYEIEIEYTNPVPQELLDILYNEGVTFNKPCTGKFSRFMNRLSAF
jgi:uncharacterized protein YjbK